MAVPAPSNEAKSGLGGNVQRVIWTDVERCVEGFDMPECPVAAHLGRSVTIRCKTLHAARVR